MKGAPMVQADGPRHGGPRVSMRDIARQAGVSPATVSAFLSGKRPVSLATRARLEAAIKMHGYRANASARALAHGRTNTIGLLIPPQGSALSAFAVEFIACVVQDAQAADYDVLVSTSLEERQVFARLIEEQRVDGVILLEVSLEDQRVDRLQAAGVPFVAVGRTRHPDGYTWVDIDFEALARAFVRHLADLRHRRIVLFNTEEELYARGFGPARRAQDGFLQACEELGVAGRVVYSEVNPESGLRVTQDLLSEGSDFTAYRRHQRPRSLGYLPGSGQRRAADTTRRLDYRPGRLPMARGAVPAPDRRSPPGRRDGGRGRTVLGPPSRRPGAPSG